MRKWLVTLALALSLGGVSVSSPLATAQEADQGADSINISEFCRMVDDFDVGHGGCVALYATDNPTAAVAERCRDPETRQRISEFFGTGEEITHGQCVELVMANFIR